MQKGFLSSNQTDSLFHIQASDNPLNAQVADNLSGTAQQLRSADNSVVYKNLNGSNIEDTNLVEQTHQKMVQTDWTDSYDTGVTSNVTETAPTINQNITLTQLHTTTINNLNETMTTTQDQRSYKVTQWDSFINNSQTNIPTNQQTTISQSGTATINQFKSQLGAQNLNTSNLNHSFGSLTSNGNMSMGGNANVNGGNITIGPGGDTSNIDFTLQKIAGKVFPKVSGKAFGEEIPLAPFIAGVYIVTGNIDLEGTLEAESKTSVNPVSFDQHSASVDLCQTLNNHFSGMTITSISNFTDLSDPPSITVEYDNSTVTFSNVTSQSIQVGVNTITYTATVPTNVSDYQDWEINASSELTLTVNFTPQSPSFFKKAEQAVLNMAESMGQNFSTPGMMGLTGAALITIIGLPIALDLAPFIFLGA